MTYRLSSSTILGSSPDVAFQTLVDAPLEDLFPTRSGAIPRVQRVESQQGAWGSVGQTRTVVLADGSRNLETLVSVSPPSDYRYTLTELTGPMRPLVRQVDGRFTFEPHGAGTRATWSWELHLTHPVVRLVLPVVAASWRRMARNMWARFSVRLPA
jgi:hypothetical protein